MKRLLWGTFVILAAAAVGSSHATTNLLTNPGFENGYTGWTTFGSGPQLSTPSTDNIARTDTAASKVFGEYTNCPPGTFTAGGYFQEFVPTANQIYEFSGYGYVSDTDTIPGSNTCLGNRMVAQVTFYDDDFGGAQIARNDVIIADYSTSRNQWVEFSVSMPAPPEADRVRCFILFMQPACDDGAVFVDDLSFCELAPPAPSLNVLVNPSFDAGLTGWTTFANVYADFRNFARRTPNAGAKMYGPFPTPPATEPVTSGMYQKFHAKPGNEWHLSVWSMTTCEEDPITGDNANYCTAKIVFKDSGSNEVGFAETLIADNTSPLGTWTFHTVSGVAPAGTDSVFAYLLFIQPPDRDDGAAFVDDVVLYEVPLPTGVPEDAPDPLFTLYQNYPNPFNPATRITFELAEPDVVELAIYDASGRRVRTLVDGVVTAGPHIVTWDGNASDGTAVASGVYWYRLETTTGQSSKKMVLLK
jgi:hypothetical protein